MLFIVCKISLSDNFVREVFLSCVIGVAINACLSRVLIEMIQLLDIAYLSQIGVFLSLRIAYLKKSGAHLEQSKCAPIAYKKKLRVEN